MITTFVFIHTSHEVAQNTACHRINQVNRQSNRHKTVSTNMAPCDVRLFPAFSFSLVPEFCCESRLSVDDGQTGSALHGVLSSDFRTSLLSQLLTFTRVQADGTSIFPAFAPNLKEPIASCKKAIFLKLNQMIGISIRININVIYVTRGNVLF